MAKDEKRLVITFPHAFFASWFKNTVQERFESALSSYLGDGYVLDYSTSAHSSGALSSIKTQPQAIKTLDYPFGRQFSFENFLFNTKNTFPLASAREVARPNGGVKYNPFVLCGASGSGKTHILRAIGNDILRHNDHLKIWLGSIEDFAAVYAEKFQNDVYSARRFITEHDVLLLDDLQQLGNFDPLQAELTTIFNNFHDHAKQMVFTCTDSIAACTFLESKLRSRLEWGLIAQLKSQDLDVRVKYVQQQLRMKQVRLRKEQIFMLCQRFPDFRNLQGVLTKLYAYRDLMSREVTERDFEQILEHADDNHGTALTPESIISLTATHFNLLPKDIIGGKRHQKIVQARQIAMFLCRQLLGSSYPALGRVFGGKDHSTAMYAVKKVVKLQQSNKDTKNTVTELKKKCLAHGEK